MEDNTNLIRIDRSLVKPAADLLSKVFQDHPVWRYYYPDDSERPGKVTQALRKIVQEAVQKGEVYATSLNLEGVAVWRYSDGKGITFWQWVLSGGLLGIIKTNSREQERQARMSQYSTIMRRRYAPFPHWFLMVIAVEPELQGKGYGSMLLRPMLTRMDKKHTPCYLETQEEKNVPMYQHYGFKVVEEGIIPGTNVFQWTMLRK